MRGGALGVRLYLSPDRCMGNVFSGAKTKPESDRLPLSKEERNLKIREGRAEGKKLKELADEFDLSPSRVCWICKGVECVDISNAERNLKIREGRAEGKKLKELADEFDLSLSRVCWICKGVKRKVVPKRERRPDPKKQERNLKIREGRAEGKKLKELADEFDLSLSRVCWICKGVECVDISNAEREKRNAKIREGYAGGKTQKELADEFGITCQRVSQICKGVKPRGMSKAEREKRNAKIREGYAGGKTQKELADEFGIARTNVSSICKGVERKVVPKRKPDPKKQEREKRNAKIREGYAGGKTQKELADEFGIARTNVSRICKGVSREKTAKRGRRPDPKIQERDKAIREGYGGGKTRAELAGKFGLSESRVSEVCKDVERRVVPKRPKRKPDPKKQERNLKIREGRAEGKKLKELADEFDLSQRRVGKICEGVERGPKALKPEEP